MNLNENVSQTGKPTGEPNTGSSSSQPKASSNDAATPLTEDNQLDAIDKLLRENGDDEGALGNPEPGTGTRGNREPETGLPPESAGPGTDDPDTGLADPDTGEAAGSDEDAEDAEPETDDAGPDTLAALAKKLGITPDDLYKIAVTTRDGETVTLGNLKDAYQDRQTAQREVAQRETQLDEREGALLLDQQLMAQVQNDLGQHLTPQTKERMRMRADEQTRFQRQQMLATIPEFADESVFANWREGAIKTMGEYGYRPQEVVITDHRMVRVIRDLMRTKERLKKLTSFDPTKVERTPPKATPVKGRAGNSGEKTRQLVNAARQGKIDPDTAISKLLGG